MPETEQSHHYYATTAIGWAVAPTRAEAIREVLRDAKGQFNPDENGGIYVYSVRVGLPKSANYKMENYQPVNVPLSDALSGSFKMKGKNVIMLTPITD